ncbi:MAG: hypothetical protein OEM40_00555, partial [Acidimicrobiia bacterium]|nr:hypothetical protein [Acidimicrobiia bacterium]
MYKMARAVLRHPTVWWEGFRAMLSMRARGGGVSPEYLRWRTATAYGDPAAEADAADVVAFLRWRRRQRRLAS